MILPCESRCLGFLCFLIGLQATVTEIKIKIRKIRPTIPCPKQIRLSLSVCQPHLQMSHSQWRDSLCVRSAAVASERALSTFSGIRVWGPLLETQAPKLPCQPLESHSVVTQWGWPLQASGVFFNPSSAELPLQWYQPPVPRPDVRHPPPASGGRAVMLWFHKEGGEGRGQASLLVVLGGACRGAGPGPSCPGWMSPCRWAPLALVGLPCSAAF